MFAKKKDPREDYNTLHYIAGFLDEFLAEKGSGFAVIRAKDFALVPLNPTNCYIGLLYLKNSNFDHFWRISTNF